MVVILINVRPHQAANYLLIMCFILWGQETVHCLLSCIRAPVDLANVKNIENHNKLVQNISGLQIYPYIAQKNKS